MGYKATIIEQITEAFADVQYPGDWCLMGSNEGDEPFATAEAFKGKTDRYAIAPKLLDEAPKGLSSALSFFSDEAFRFYLPAYMIADLRGDLREVNVVFHLTHGLDDKSREKLINSNRYGQRTWFESNSHKFSIFTREQAIAIVIYLRFKRKKDKFARAEIDQALRSYWNGRIV